MEYTEMEADEFLSSIKNPVQDWILMRKTARGDQVDGEFVEDGIILPDTVWDNTNFVEIVFTGPECKKMSRGWITWCPEFPDSLQDTGCPESYWWVKERDLTPVRFEDNRILPLDDYVIIEMRPEDGQYLGEVAHEGEIVLSARRLQYSPWGVLRAVGPLTGLDASLGETVLVDGDSWTFKVGDVTYMLCHQDRIVAKDEDMLNTASLELSEVQ